jgi:hypothetical protein
LFKKAMIRKALLVMAIGIIANTIQAQDLKTASVPAVVRAAFIKKYPNAAKVSWEKENGNYEANWGGKSGEDNSVMYTPAGIFVEIVNVIPVSQLPAKVVPYVKQHYKGAKIAEAGKVTDAKGNLTYEAEIKGMDLIFDTNGNFIKKD